MVANAERPRSESAMNELALQPHGWERSAVAAEQVRERLRRSVAALEAAGIPYAVIGGNAVAEWVGRADEAAVRTTQDVDILVRRSDLEAIKVAMIATGFEYRHSSGIDMFLDGRSGKARDAVHLVFAGEKVRSDHEHSAPEVGESESAASFRVVRLVPLIRMKLTSFRDKHRTHLRDMIEVGLIDSALAAQLPPTLAARLQELLDNPDG
jgi:hypothetical protein